MYIFGEFNLKVGWNIACWFCILGSLSRALVDENRFCGGSCVDSQGLNRQKYVLWGNLHG